jgi:lysophospholipase L1-like esterase
MKRLLTLLFVSGMLLLAAAEKKIVFVGDSISCGVGASPKEMRFSTVAVKLLSENGGKYVEKNIAVSGSTMSNQPWPSATASGYPHRLKDVIREKPDILVIQHGVNDNGVRLSLAEYVWSYREFIRSVKKALPATRIVCMTITPAWRSAAAELHLAMASTAIQEIAARENCVVVQINQALDGKREFFPDRLHPNNDGHRLMAETLAAAIKADRVRKYDCFDFAIRRAGTYHICGWTFEISAEAEKGGYTVFRDMGKGGFTYSSFAPVKIISPMNYYYAPFTGKAEGITSPIKQSWHAYTKAGNLTLPATGGKPVKVVISVQPQEKGHKGK